MKTLQQRPAAMDRISTHEELHQVLVLVSEGASFPVEPPSDADEKKALQEAVADLWQDTSATLNEQRADENRRDHDNEGRPEDEISQWAELLAAKTARIN